VPEAVELGNGRAIFPSSCAPHLKRFAFGDSSLGRILPDSEQRSEDTLSSPWWSIPQAIIWIVTRSESQVLRADSVRTVAALERMIGMRRASGLDVPPVSLAAAPDELLQARQARRIALFGCKWGREPSRLILGPRGLGLRDYRGEVCLGDRTHYFDTRPFWSNLSVRADDCKGCWPEPATRTQPASGPSVSARRPSDGEVRAFIEEKREALRAERKRAGRDVLLRATMNQFSLSRKVALDIWNGVPRDRKGGRPTKDKPDPGRSIAKRVR
jgi:hypothetical protein